MTQLLKEIINIIGRDSYGSYIELSYYPNDKEMVLYIYEVRVPIVITKQGIVYIDADNANCKLTTDMMSELLKIMELIENNIKLFTQILD